MAGAAHAFQVEPADWRLMGVVCGPCEVDPNIRSASEWCAWRVARTKERVEGAVSHPWRRYSSSRRTWRG
jgi:3-deoxy-D-arabino-heptulosonate 7-phosphate (DAHP) synthase